MQRRTVLPLTSLALAGVFLGGALGHAPAAGDTAKKLTGTLVCIGCTVKKAYSAKAQCNVYGHQHGLQTADGKIYTFLANDQSKELREGKAKDAEDLHGKKVEVTGVVLPKTQILDVTSYQVAK
ncbi:MAG: hypothetical protein COZ06_31165 [Armatimonadetes bacterium CG_4_10_14_3_um_filter_66_18]|nr:hypothetical protein [Armatimonadota bacterium]OIP10237.1 MAG: hypothetical protein AUJ96_04180 [Armatimonadetes bacterium CG2_30_66_41]PIU94015.1 MAG: hypothetical protein COS65_09805 [Armatimonadetes bacterium CG06_land_8_20_14_3_00_66_21]PIW18323.1 MAG: hypothetical protein COW34_04370 [Armatimonadetes bacterium CG17_big_fil_post_rev_8_21_14_2_50_66_6]PIX43227.1 MAG: hypothetical protein COZ57_19570 [Armatimonadetes bacterium CG_4_8_14_3_um_filter_66_20]PIY38461.1 MAG: hypothetical prote